MVNIPKDLKYTSTHEWVRIDGNTAVVGITDAAQDKLGDVALVSLPEVGKIVAADEEFGEIESIKAVSELYSPVSGEIIAVNADLADAPESVNNDPYGEGWLVKIAIKKVSELDDLLDAAAYARVAEEE